MFINSFYLKNNQFCSIIVENHIQTGVRQGKMRRFISKNILNNLKFNQKFLVIYVCCVIFPLIITDGLILNAFIKAELNDRRYDRESEANAYRDYIFNTVEYDEVIANAVEQNASFNEMITKQYASLYDYYAAYADFQNTSFFKSMTRQKTDIITVYVDNPTIGNGNGFRQLELHRDDLWYKKFMELDVDNAVLIFYDDTENLRFNERKKAMFVKKLDYFGDNVEKIITIENTFDGLDKGMASLPTNYPMFIVCNDYIAFSNVNRSDFGQALNEYLENNKYMTKLDYEYRNSNFQIYVFNENLIINNIISENWKIGAILLIITLVLPLLIMGLVEKSILGRINELQSAFSGDDSGTFIPIMNIEGRDEFASLMNNYNRIVAINNDLINTVYIDKLREQESDIARKNAELLALQSQINPHFLFNALESIRMHSMLKGEDETAEMIEKLAVMERQNCEWGNDFVTIKKEVEFIEAYLYLQSYRFGDRLSFDIDIDEDCQNILIPKLTLVTFVENACVHGIESKSSQGWIFVRVYRKEGLLYIEVEDTGDGMEEDDVQAMCFRMNNVTIESLKSHKRVGILNACLRIRMMFDDKVKFDIESEKGVGLSVVIKIAEDKLKEVE